MAINQEDQVNAQYIMHWLKNRWKNRLCIVCGFDTWKVIPKEMELREKVKSGGIIIGGGLITVSFFPITCQNCGYTFLLLSDLVKPPSVNNVIIEKVEPEKKK